MEYITANGVEYAAIDVMTSMDSISFTLEDHEVSAIKNAFTTVTELTVSGEDKEVYGTYTDIKFQSITEFDNGNIRVTMHIKSEIEKRLDDLDAKHEINAGAIEELAAIVGGE